MKARGRRWTPPRAAVACPMDGGRSAIRVLDEIRFLDRTVASGSSYKAMEDGLRCKPILFVFGSDHAPLFIAANRRAAAARGRPSGERRGIAVSPAKSLHGQFSSLPAQLPQSHRRIGIPCAYGGDQKGKRPSAKDLCARPKT